MWVNSNMPVPDVPQTFGDVLPSSVLSPKFNPKVIRTVALDLSPVTNQKKLAYVLENVFTAEECQSLIDLSEKTGYVPALVNVGNGMGVKIPGYRDSHRVLIDDKEFVAILLQRISKFLPPKFKGRELVEINERLRFLRYDPGDQFKQHYDGHYARPDNSAKTLITLQMYLNEGFGGGETTFLYDMPGRLNEKRARAKGKTSGGIEEEAKPKVAVVPKTGSILVFEHQILHEGSLLDSGRKYTIRTDVLYTWDGSYTSWQYDDDEVEEEEPSEKKCTIT